MNKFAKYLAIFSLVLTLGMVSMEPAHANTTSTVNYYTQKAVQGVKSASVGTAVGVILNLLLTFYQNCSCTLPGQAAITSTVGFSMMAVGALTGLVHGLSR